MKSPLGADLEAFAGMLGVSLSCACCNPTRVAVAVCNVARSSTSIMIPKPAKAREQGVHKRPLLQHTGNGGSGFLAHHPERSHTSTQRHTPARLRLSRTRQGGETAPDTGALALVTPPALTVLAYCSHSRSRDPLPTQQESQTFILSQQQLSSNRLNF